VTSEYLNKPKRAESEVRTERDYLNAAIGWRKIIWRQAAKDEDERIDRLVDICTKLHDGDKSKGRTLATLAIWNTGP
jgi:hypothetical protein